MMCSDLLRINKWRKMLLYSRVFNFSKKVQDNLRKTERDSCEYKTTRIILVNCL